MVKGLTLLALCLAAVTLSAGARLPLQVAPAPAPAASSNNADLLFIVSARQATFNAGGTVTFSNVSQTAQFTSTGGRSGIYPIQVFVNSSAGTPFVGANGQWLDTPQGALYGSTAEGNATVVLLSLSGPTYDAAAEALTFNYSVVQPQQGNVKFTGGAVAEVVADEASNSGLPALTGVQDGASLMNVALFIDQNQGALHPAASTKDWWRPWGGGWGGWGWGRGGWGWGWNGGWGGGWNGWGNGGSTVVVVQNGWGK